MCTINDNHISYCSLDIKHEKQIFLSFWTVFCPFNRKIKNPKNLKNQNFEKMKKAPGDIIILHKCTKNDNHMIYDS